MLAVDVGGGATLTMCTWPFSVLTKMVPALTRLEGSVIVLLNCYWTLLVLGEDLYCCHCLHTWPVNPVPPPGLISCCVSLTLGGNCTTRGAKALLAMLAFGVCGRLALTFVTNWN